MAYQRAIVTYLLLRAVFVSREKERKTQYIRGRDEENGKKAAVRGEWIFITRRLTTK